MCAPTLIDFAIGTSGRTSSWYRRRFYKPNCSFAVQIVAKVSTRPNKQGPQVIESIDAQMRASNALGAGGRAFKCMRQANPIYTAARVGDAVMGWTNKRRWYRSGGGGVAGKLSNWWPNTKPAG